ncbi:hypothetical protein P154DRAFT_520004 [Amniculicola lignicola CBS 123094]|uniref:Uncharacterized protein n=1 Tax=Amniculicola lignicola CBS 123094 TaxID=1392246 RepID=A0A6A5WWD1_9PLEO|nr:hypothetical protein P154DRAFT_520004 [Amniculicola lignicola CBS 123094]
MVPAASNNTHTPTAPDFNPSLTRASTIASNRALQLSNHLIHSTTNMSASTTPQPAQAATTVGTNIDADVPDIYNHLPALPQNWPEAHPDFLHSQPPVEPDLTKGFSVFTAGSIEMGRAIKWQTRLVDVLRPLPVTVCNPRRGMWETHKTPEANDNAFQVQVKWELSCLEKVSVICFYFDRETLSPVTLLELGLWAHSKKVVVCCPTGFWKGGNVRIVCERYGIPFAETFSELVPEIVKMLHEKGMDSQWTLPALPVVKPLPKN